MLENQLSWVNNWSYILGTWEFVILFQLTFLYAYKRIYLQCGRHGFDPWVGKIPWRKERLPTTVFWPGEFHGHTLWGHKELDTTERLSLSLSSIESFLFNPPLIWNFLSSLDKTFIHSDIHSLGHHIFKSKGLLGFPVFF